METLVIKLGGSRGIDVERFLAALARLETPFVLVHGANAELDDLMRRLGVEPRLVTSSTGQVSRYTDRATMDLFLMTYCGRVNKRIVEALQQQGRRAVGLSGMDGMIVRGRRKPRIRVVENGKSRVLEGDYAGSIESVDPTLIQLLLANGSIPVLTPPAVSDEGEAINVDGDKLAMELAVALAATRLIIFSNTAGLLRDLDDPSSTVPIVEVEELDTYLAMAQGRMKKKVQAAANAVRRGVGEVILASANAADPIESALRGSGTHVVVRNEL
ncbi:MAG TPA: [LysW]-aminoadipate kinase [Chloroflexota bacterium]|nr:[LysW]-aminoadipate kinase [Chloroflexota bacterium]